MRRLFYVRQLFVGMAIAAALIAAPRLPARATSEAAQQQPETVARNCWVHNWMGWYYDGRQWRYDGSCSFAAYAAALEVCGYHDQAVYVRGHFGGAAGLDQLERASGSVPYVETAPKWDGQRWQRDPDFIRRCCADGRGCVVGLHGGAPCVPYMARYDQYGNLLCGHAVYVFHFDGERCGLLDSNFDRGAIRWVTCDQLLNAWQGWAIAPAFKR